MGREGVRCRAGPDWAGDRVATSGHVPRSGNQDIHRPCRPLPHRHRRAVLEEDQRGGGHRFDPRWGRIGRRLPFRPVADVRHASRRPRRRRHHARPGRRKPDSPIPTIARKYLGAELHEQAGAHRLVARIRSALRSLQRLLGLGGRPSLAPWLPMVGLDVRRALRADFRSLLAPWAQVGRQRVAQGSR